MGRLETLLQDVEARYRGTARVDAMTILYARFAELDPLAAYEHALAHGLALANPWSAAWTDAIFRAWARQDLQTAIEFADQVSARQVAISAILAGRPDLPARERAAISRRLSLRGNEELLTAAEIVQLVDDPKAAFERLDPSRHETRRAALIVWTLRDGRAALTALDTQANRSSEGLARDMMRLWARRSPQDAVDWALARDAEASRRRYVSAALEGLTARNPEQAATIAAGLGDAIARQDAVSSVLSTWARQEPAAAIEWFTSLSEGATRRQALRAIASSYGRYDPDAAFAWARELPPRDSDIALAPILHLMAYARSPEAALRGLSEINDDGVRFETARRVASEWTKTDPQAAYRWADARPDAAERDRLLDTVLFSWRISNMSGFFAMVNGIEDSAEYERMVLRLEELHVLAGEELVHAYERVTDPSLKARLAERLVQTLEMTDPARAETFRTEAGIADAQP